MKNIFYHNQPNVHKSTIGNAIIVINIIIIDTWENTVWVKTEGDCCQISNIEIENKYSISITLHTYTLLVVTIFLLLMEYYFLYNLLHLLIVKTLLT